MWPFLVHPSCGRGADRSTRLRGAHTAVRGASSVLVRTGFLPRSLSPGQEHECVRHRKMATPRALAGGDLWTGSTLSWFGRRTSAVLVLHAERQPTRWAPRRLSDDAVVDQGDHLGEAHLSAQQPSPGQASRLPPPHVHPQWPGHHQGPSGQGSEAALGLIDHVRGRSAFAEFRTGRRSSDGPLTIVYVQQSYQDSADDPGGVAVAYSVPRKVGGAVERNRLRRQLRPIIAGLEATGSLGAGSYLVIVRPEARGLSSDALLTHVRNCMDRFAR